MTWHCIWFHVVWITWGLCVDLSRPLLVLYVHIDLTWTSVMTFWRWCHDHKHKKIHNKISPTSFHHQQHLKPQIHRPIDPLRVFIYETIWLKFSAETSNHHFVQHSFKPSPPSCLLLPGWGFFFTLPFSVFLTSICWSFSLRGLSLLVDKVDCAWKIPVHQQFAKDADPPVRFATSRPRSKSLSIWIWQCLTLAQCVDDF